MEKSQLLQQLKELIVSECAVDLDSHEIEDHAPLIGEGCRLELASLDALSISLEDKSRFGKHIDSGNETRLALTSVDALANFILAE